jgi:hypothetical protein
MFRLLFCIQSFNNLHVNLIPQDNKESSPIEDPRFTAGEGQVLVLIAKVELFEKSLI